MAHWKTISGIRREYGQLKLGEADILESPIAQFKRWFEEGLATEVDDPTAMVLSTVDEKGHPDSRVVLLKEIQNESFVFYTNYLSAKGQQIANNPHAALNFYWPKMVRQVRIRGKITKTNEALSDAYFSSRPISSQISAILSSQSQLLSSRVELEEKINATLANLQSDESIKRPDYWGGYALEAYEIEFWQGRDNRVHDRILYTRKDSDWSYERLAP